MNKIIIIDGYSLLFRSFYATYNEDKEKMMRSKDGVYTNAIYTFINMLLPLMKNLKKDDAIFVALDSSKTTFRHQQYKEYKANRKPLPNELKEQFPILRELLDTLNIKYYEDENLEADDIAGNVAKMMEKERYKVEIYTSDRDYLQLINKNITVDLIIKGVKNIKVMTPESFIEEYKFEPIKIIDYKALRGDSSDNLKGIPGIGETTATNLILQYGDFENIIKNANSNTGIGKKLIKFQDDGRMCLALATIKTDDILPIKKDDLIYKGYDFDNVVDFATKYNFKNLTTKLPPSLRIKTKNEKIEYEVITSIKNIVINDEIGLYIDISNDNYHSATLYGLSLYINGSVYYISYDNLIKDNELLDILRSEKIKKYSFNFKKVKGNLNYHNIEINGLEFDLLLAAYLLNPNLNDDYNSVLTYFNVYLPEFNDEELSLFDTGKPALTSFIAYYSYNLKNEAIEKLKEKNQYELLLNIEQPLTLVLSDMESEGFPLNKEKLLEFRKEYETKRNLIEEAIFKLNDDETFNLNSPKQLGEVLYDKLKLNGPKNRSTNIDALIKIIHEHPIIPLIIEYRKYSKLISTTIDGFIPFIDNNGLIHTTFNQSVTRTGRLSSSEPNLQNISIKDEEGKAIRKCFYYEDPNTYILSLDYSQIELRVLAHLSNSSTMIDVFNKDLDIHSETAKKIFHLDREPTSLERRHAKTVNFGIIYGMSDWGLADELQISVKEAKDIIKSFNDEFPEIKNYFNDVIKNAEENKYTTTIFNRRRYLENINSSVFMEREAEKRIAMNAPIQGSAADLIKIAMIKVDKALKYNGFKARIINQIHDEIMLKVPSEEKEKVYNLVKEIMETCVSLKVKLKVDGGYARTWYDVK